MSLKSFDKFCEKMILGEPGSEKEILDERQNQVRTKLTVEALAVYIAAILVNSVVMEKIYQWCDSYCTPMLVLGVIGYMYWIIRNAAKGSLFGVKGTRTAKYTAFFIIFEGFMFSFIYVFPIFENEKEYLFAEGRVTSNFMLMLVWAAFFACGILILALAKRYDKRAAKNNNNEK